MKHGKKESAQKLMRGRVAMQGFTLIALLGTGLFKFSGNPFIEAPVEAPSNVILKQEPAN